MPVPADEYATIVVGEHTVQSCTYMYVSHPGTLLNYISCCVNNNHVTVLVSHVLYLIYK